MKKIFNFDVIKVGSGVVGAQILQILFLPILVNLYTPEDFGVYSYLLNFGNIILVVLSLRYEYAIVLEKNKFLRSQIIFVSVAIMIIILLIIFMLREAIKTVSNNELILNNENFNLLLLYLLSGGGLSIAYMVQLREKKYSLISFNKIVASGLTVALSVQLVRINDVKLNYNKLLMAMVIAQLIVSIINIKYLINNNSKIIKKRILHVIRKYRKFPLINSVHALSDIAQTSITTLLIANAYNLSELGLYAIATRLVKTPLGVISNATSQIFLSSAALKTNSEQLTEYVKSTIYRNGVLGIGIAFLSYTILPLILEKYFNSEWIKSFIYIKIIIIPACIGLVVSPLSQIALIRNRQGISFAINFIETLCVLLTVFVCAKNGIAMEKMLIIMATVTSISLIVYGYWLYDIAIKTKKISNMGRI